ncbi:MAG: MBL fold metallo-hydrolase [Clostridia bacterium]|nr:MBL fold metallo-hydrolase [Clostridia bacterium]
MKRIVCLFAALAVLFAFAASASPVKQLSKGAKPSFGADADLLYLCFFDTMASDAILIRQGGKTMLVDCADTNYGSNVIAPKLRELGIERIDYAVNTHPHDDHINGFISLFDEVEVGAFYTCFPLDFCAEQIACVKAAREHGIEVVRFDSSADLSFGDLKIRVWQDARFADKGPAACNALSLVMHITYQNSAVLLSADAPKDCFVDLAKEKGALIDADIIKMPHHGHGQPTYAAWQLISPELAVITNSTANRISATIQFLHNNRCPYLLTGNGYVEAFTDGKTWQVVQFDKWNRNK